MTTHIVFRPIEPTVHEFRSGTYPDIAIRVENVSNQREAMIKLRAMLNELTREDGLEAHVTREVTQ